jgi:hypothetical protein
MSNTNTHIARKHAYVVYIKTHLTLNKFSIFLFLSYFFLIILIFFYFFFTFFELIYAPLVMICDQGQRHDLRLGEGETGWVIYLLQRKNIRGTYIQIFYF